MTSTFETYLLDQEEAETMEQQYTAYTLEMTEQELPPGFLTSL